MVWGAIIGGVSSILGGAIGQSSANDAAKRAENLRYKADLQTYNYQTEAQQQAYDFSVEGVNIQRQNNLINAAFTDANNIRNWQYTMQVRAFENAMERRAYEMRKEQAETQINFNNLSTKLSTSQIKQWKAEQQLSLDFQEKTTNLEFRYNQLGQVMSFQEADLARQQTRAMSQLEGQKNYVNSLKAKGEAQTRGASGVTAEKMAGAAIAEAGLNAAAITQQVFNAESTFGLTSKQIGINLERINESFYLDKAKIAASRTSLNRQAQMARVTQRVKGLEANLQALYSIGFEPVMGPAPPAPMRTPIPILQDPMKPIPLPEPIKGAAYNVNPLLGALSGAGQSIGAAAQQIGSYLGSRGPGSGGSIPFSPNVNLGFGAGMPTSFSGFSPTTSFSGNFAPASASSLGSFGLTDTSVSFSP